MPPPCSSHAWVCGDAGGNTPSWPVMCKSTCYIWCKITDYALGPQIYWTVRLSLLHSVKHCSTLHRLMSPVYSLLTAQSDDQGLSVSLHCVVISEPAQPQHPQLALTLRSGCVYICMRAVLCSQSWALKQTGRLSPSFSNVSQSYHYFLVVSVLVTASGTTELEWQEENTVD